MKKLLPLSLLLISSQVPAIELTDIIKGLEQPNNLSEPNQCLTETIDEELYHQCAIDLCGKPELSSTAMVNDINFNRYLDEKIKDRLPEVEGPVRKIFSTKKQEHNSFVAALKTKLDSQDALNPMKWETWEATPVASNIFNDFVDVAVDTDKPLADRIEMTVNYPEDASETVKKAIDEFAEMKKHNMLNIPSEGMYNEIYTKEESMTLFKDLAKKFYAELDKQIQKEPELLNDSQDEIEKYKNIDSLELEDNFKIASAWMNVNFLYNKLLSATGQPVYLENKKYCEENCKKGLQEHLSKLDLKTKITDFEKALNQSSAEDAILACQAKMLQGQLKEGNKTNFLKQFPDIKKNFQLKVTAGFSDHSKKAWDHYIDKDVHLSFAHIGKTSADDFLEELRQNSEKTSDDFSNASISNLLINLNQYRDWQDRSKYAPRLSDCLEDKTFTAWDAFVPREMAGDYQTEDSDPKKDNILVSPFSCSHVTEGRGVISHEMGHALSYAFHEGKLSKHSEEAYNKIRECTTKLYITPIKSTGAFMARPNDSYRTEEDMADVVGFMATKDDKKFSLCALLETNKPGTRYTDLALVNATKEDTHSSPMLRVVREALYKKKPLSPSCKSIIEKNSDKFRFKPCM